MSLKLKGEAGGLDNQYPCFSAYPAAAQSMASGVFSVVFNNTEEFDTNSNFDTTTNRFTPTVAGYYLITGAVLFASSVATAISAIYKNGVEVKRGAQSGSAASSGALTVVNALIYLNGSTDYVDLRAYQNSGGAVNTNPGGGVYCYFQGHLVRPAA